VRLIIGTSGWQYRHWRDMFYPPDVPQRRWLEYYAEQFATVENDGTFYRLPDGQTFAGWRDRTPADFVMAVKASRYLTHVRRLNDPAEAVRRLLQAATRLGSGLGPVLLQLPPTLKADPPKLAACLAEFGKAAAADGTGPVKVAVEPRHPSWWTEETRDVLTACDAALCWADRQSRPITPLWRTSSWGYLRFHEGAGDPWPRYGQAALRSWVGELTRTWPGGNADIYVYFNNDQNGAAITDATAFAALARSASQTVTRTPRQPAWSGTRSSTDQP
jgi:uncharacterized protein YecE (DUF72 family)